VMPGAQNCIGSSIRKMDLAMSGNILSTIAHSLTSGTIAEMAARARIDGASARKAAELGVPAILGALTELLSRPKGDARLTSVLARPWFNHLDTSGPLETSGLSMQGQQGGSSLLTFLLGEESACILANTIGRCVGACQGAMHPFLDTLMATILHALVQQCCAARPDGKEIANLLRVERDLVATAMPAGLASLLRGNGFYERLGRSLPPVPALAAQSRTWAGKTTARPPATASGVASLARDLYATWPYWVLPLLALTGLGWYFLAGNMSHRAGGANLVIAPLPEFRSRAASTASVNGNSNLAAADQGRDDDNRVDQKSANVTEVAGADPQTAAAVVSQGRFLGIGEADLHRRHDQNGGEVRPLADPAKDELSIAATPWRRHLRFVSPEFKGAIPQRD
jgi:Bacterial protein of unknown function (DUF937)